MAAMRAFDADNTYHYLNNIPFADHGALLDPPTEDVTGRCIGMLMQLGESKDAPRVKAAVDYLRARAAQGWQLVRALGRQLHLRHLVGAGRIERGRSAGPRSPMMKKAAEWLISIQNEDGGWGEDCDSYKLDYRGL